MDGTTRIDNQGVVDGCRRTTGADGGGQVEKEMCSEVALTMALLGLIDADAIIGPRLGGKYRKRRVR